MAAITSEPATGSCSHCGKDIPTSNIELHYAHCSRNLQRCAVCGDMVPKKHADEHYYNNHAPVFPLLFVVHCRMMACHSETVEREVLALHKGEKCPQRIITCDYCEFPLPAVDLVKHQEVCGNRTEYCNTCNSYVRLRERVEHEIRFHHGASGASEFSSAGMDASEREGGDRLRRRWRRREPQAGDHHHGVWTRWNIMVSIAVTGVALAIGSLFLQRKMDNREPPQ